jgi:hypothetical protein
MGCCVESEEWLRYRLVIRGVIEGSRRPYGKSRDERRSRRVSRCREWAEKAYNRAVFEFKKKIPAEDYSVVRVTRKLAATIALAVAASNSTAMGACHFFLPFMFRWGAFLKKVPQPIPWALFSINFFFSFLLFAGGILTFVALRALRRASHADRGVLFAMAAFWLANTLYQVFIPMPLPAALWPLHVVLLGFAAVTLLAYGVGLLAMRER